MADYLHSDPEKPNLDHPDSAIRLASAVHRFRVPRMKHQVSFPSSFRTVGRHDTTRKLMRDADDARNRLAEAVGASKVVSGERVVADSKRYQPLIHAILVSCKVQPEEARLDEKLVFEWMSGIEESPKAFRSEAIMYDLVMTVVSEGLGQAALATECSAKGEFAAGSRAYAAAAGIFQFLADDQLPKWISRGQKVDDDQLPSECHAPAAKALSQLFQAHGQQMAVATVLIKEGTPNYSLLAKLTLGISEQLEDFMSALRRDAFHQLERMDKDFFTLVAFQINLQQSLSLYFQARALWESTEYGMAIALLSEATVALRTRETSNSKGVPDVSKVTALAALGQELLQLRQHMQFVLQNWETDNSQVYFTSVPQKVPAGKKLQQGIQMKKATPYALQEVEPVLLVLPEGALQRSDSDLARELQARLNAGGD